MTRDGPRREAPLPTAPGRPDALRRRSSATRPPAIRWRRRAPNIFIPPNWGVIYSSSKKKISEHGGGTLDDTGVALIVSHPGLRHRTIDSHVFTKQVAPTIPSALDLDPKSLEAVRKEHASVLPGLGF